MRIFELFLLIGLIVCALSVSFTKKLLTSIIIYMSYSSIMAIIWVILQSPDLAVTEAAVGAGVTSILFFVTLKKIRAIEDGGAENPAVAEIFALSRKVANEAHQFLEFIRFEELANGVLFATISPKSRVLMLVAPHFADRFPGENWLIYDDVREEAVVHAAGEDWVTAKLPKERVDAFLAANGVLDGYEDLWKAFFHAIGIKERENPDCQRNFLPLWYRKHMTEFL